MDKFKKNYHLLILFAGVLAGGFISIALGKEVNWDMANYHFYNPFAFLSHRLNVDYWPAEFIHVHIAPTADFLTYYLITLLQPKTAVFALGALHGINLWLLFLIARYFLSELTHNTYTTNTLSLACAVVGMYGPTALTSIGSFQHDQLVSLVVFGFLLLFLNREKSVFRTVVSGAILGAAIGLKLTAAIYVIGAVAGIMLTGSAYKERATLSLQVLSGVVLGLLLTSGYWMLLMWNTYHNPVFPFFNNIFHSAQFPSASWADDRFLPHDFKQAFLFPFYFSLDGRTGDLSFRDFRFAAVYVLLVMFIVAQLLAMFKVIKMPKLSGMAHWFTVFFVASYVAWQVEFSIMRYAMALEMLAPLLIVMLLYAVFTNATLRFGLGAAVFIGLVVYMQPVRVIRIAHYEGSYFNVRLPHLGRYSHPAMVLMAFPAYAMDLKPRPQTYLIPFLPREWVYVGIPFQNRKFHLPAEVVQRVNRYSGQFYVMSSSEFLPQMNLAAWQLGLKSGGACGNITSDRQRITHEDVILCQFYKA